ncbi:DUF6236 family protein [Nocardia sp. NPDC005998]|uniref:DUF6236 family protein n=1 Tax=Nocardia sp. NPDC005998 TaxID=3156894 RepID=UPI0033BCFBD3
MDDWFGLYFQHVHFRRDRWLKVIALYWDQIYHLYNDETQTSLPRISPTELALSSAGFVRPITPSTASIERAAEQFIAATSALDIARYRPGVAPGISSWEFEESLASWKVSPPLVALLREMGWATDAGGDRLLMHEVLAQAYLLFLAGGVADELGAAPLADDSFYQSTAGLSAKRLIAGMSSEPAPLMTSDEQRAYLVNMAITTVLPRDIDEYPVDKIIDFRNRYRGERAMFKHALNGLVIESTQLEGVRNREALLDHLRARYENRVAPALDSLDRAMRGQRMDTVLGVMNIQAAAPAALSSSLALLALHPAAPGAAAIGLGGLAIGVWKSAQQASRQHRTTLAESPVSYLYHLREDLNPTSLAENVRQAIARFAPRGK